MEEKSKKCSFSEHKEIKAISYCQECKIYMCNKCLSNHSGLLENHHQYNLDNDNNIIFIDICKEKKHSMKLEYYCKTHNNLCCAACIAKIEGKGNGQHKDCNIIFIEEIKEEKKIKLKENINFLSEFLNSLDNSVKELKILFEKINEDKEKIKIKIQKIFTKFRNILNDKEDELLLKVDNKYNEILFNEDIIKESEKLPFKIKISLEKGKALDNKWNDDNKLVSNIIDCINIETIIKNINLINENIQKCKLNNAIQIDFSPKEEDINSVIKAINEFGEIINKTSRIDSLILNKEVDLNKLYALFSNHIELKDRCIELLYRYSKDGLSYQTIVDKINNKSNLIFLYLTENQRIFGVYINAKLDDINPKKKIKDEKAFVFSLNNNKIYKILIPQNAIRFNNISYIIIGNDGNSNGFYFNCKSNSINDNGLLKETKYYDFQKNGELTEGNGKINELEIFKIT